MGTSESCCARDEINLGSLSKDSVDAIVNKETHAALCPPEQLDASGPAESHTHNMSLPPKSGRESTDSKPTSAPPPMRHSEVAGAANDAKVVTGISSPVDEQEPEVTSSCTRPPPDLATVVPQTPMNPAAPRTPPSAAVASPGLQIAEGLDDAPAAGGGVHGAVVVLAVVPEPAHSKPREGTVTTSGARGVLADSQAATVRETDDESVFGAAAQAKVVTDVCATEGGCLTVLSPYTHHHLSIAVTALSLRSPYLCSQPRSLRCHASRAILTPLSS